MVSDNNNNSDDDARPRAVPLTPAWQHGVALANDTKPEWSLLDKPDDAKLPETINHDAVLTRCCATAPQLRAVIPASGTRPLAPFIASRTEMVTERRSFAGLTRAGLRVAWQDAKNERGRRRQDFEMHDIFQVPSYLSVNTSNVVQADVTENTVKSDTSTHPREHRRCLGGGAESATIRAD